jgi:AcrR family transcriptional regulator
MMSRMVTSNDLQTDGRIQRSERSREAIVQAMLDLIDEGTLSPTAQQVAARADVGVRTVFRHFSDMETLFATINSRLWDEYLQLFVREEQEGPLQTRIDHMLENRFRILDRLAPYTRAGSLQRAKSAFLQKQHDWNIRMFRADILFWLPEIKADDSPLLSALEVLLSFEAYERLHVDQKLSTRKSQATISLATRALLASLDEA